MRIVSDGGKEGAEVDISGTIQEFRELGQTLLNLEGRLEIEGNQERDPFYNKVLRGISFEPCFQDSPNMRLTIEIDRDVICFVGPIDCFEKLGQSLLNIFTEGIPSGQHFHLDYYEGNQLLEPTKHELIFSYA